MASGAPTTAIHYPSGDGKPMAETWLHVRAIVWLHQALEDFFRDRTDVFIASDIFWYWEKGNPEACIAPDVMAVFDVAQRDPRERRSYYSWEEGGRVPAVVFEMASESTVDDDLGKKFLRYEELGVREYFLFDPEGAHLVPVLQGFRLNRTAYRRIQATGGLLQSDLGFKLSAENTMLRLIDRNGKPIPTRLEAAEGAEKARIAAEEAATAARALADAERTAKEAEKRRADALQEEIERLRARLQQLGGANGNGP